MNEQEVLQVLRKVGAVITDSHIVYTSGKHGTAYINKDAIYPHTAETSFLCEAIAGQFLDDNVEVVIAPAVGGVILSQWTAHWLTQFLQREVLGVYAEKKTDSFLHPDCIGIPGATRSAYSETGDFIIKRGYDKIVYNKRVAVVKDLLNTGGSVRKVVFAVRACGGNVVGVGVLCNRGGVTLADLGGVPKLIALANVKMDSWDEKDCPLCSQGVPINTDVGHGREFLARGQYAR